MDVGVSCAGRCPCQAVRVFASVCVDTRLWACCAGRWHHCIAGATLANRGRTGRRWEKEEEMGCESKTEWVRMVVKMKAAKGE